MPNDTTFTCPDFYFTFPILDRKNYESCVKTAFNETARHFNNSVCLIQLIPEKDDHITVIAGALDYYGQRKKASCSHENENDFKEPIIDKKIKEHCYSKFHFKSDDYCCYHNYDTEHSKYGKQCDLEVIQQMLKKKEKKLLAEKQKVASKLLCTYGNRPSGDEDECHDITDGCFQSFRIKNDDDGAYGCVDKIEDVRYRLITNGTNETTEDNNEPINKIFIEYADLNAGLSCYHLKSYTKEEVQTCFVTFSAYPNKNLKEQYEEDSFNTRIICCCKPSTEFQAAGSTKQCNAVDKSGKFKRIEDFDDRL
uniref:Uncharacterized protein n=1 Tax=Panagrolaimus sp. JU765 TaxID=591449 RepID=A0AC34QDB2_9BILA